MEVDTLDTNWQVLEDAIQKTRGFLTAPELTAGLFSAAECMAYYTCVYNICLKNRTMYAQNQLLERYKNALEESIQSVVLPMIRNRHDDSLLAGVLDMWERYKVMTRVLMRIFHYIGTGNVWARPSLECIANNSFCDLVCTTYFSDFQRAVISLINQGRQGKQIDPNLLKSFLVFFSETAQQGDEYSKGLEHAIHSDAAIYFTQLASTWLSSETYSNCLLKAAWAFRQEEMLACQYLSGAMLDNYIQVMRQNMLQLLGKKAMEEQETEEVAKSSFQELVFNVSTMSISGEPSSSQPSHPQ